MKQPDKVLNGMTAAQQETLVWRKETQEKIARIVAKYPEGRQQSAVIPVLKLAQDEFGGWLSVAAMNLVAQTLAMPYIRVYEVATFYTMFNLKPVGKYHVQVCTNCACMIRGSDAVLKAVEEAAGTLKGTTSADNMFTITEVECLGACVDAPMMQINNHYYTRLTAEESKKILATLRAGEEAPTDTPADVLETGY